MLYLLKAKVEKLEFSFLNKINYSNYLGGESEQNITPMDIQGTGNTIEQQDSQSKTNEAHSSPNTIQPIKRSYIIPKIWMDFDDFCSCFTSVVVFHNPRGYRYTNKHTEVKVK